VEVDGRRHAAADCGNTKGAPGARRLRKRRR
jgi:hypothetical protein